MTHTTTHQTPIHIQWTDSHALAHDRAAMARPLRRRAAGFLLTLVMLGLATTAHAEGGTTQGTSLQGVAHQSTNISGSGARAGRVEGGQLIDWLLARPTEQTMFVEIACLRGDSLDAPISDLHASAPGGVQLRPGAIIQARWQTHLCVPIMMFSCAETACLRDRGRGAKYP